jgi:hypothetical protein
MLDEGNQEKLERMRKVVDLNFGYGKYYYLGRQVALLELHKMIFEVRDKLRKSRGYFEENRANEKCSCSGTLISRLCIIQGYGRAKM